MKLTSAALTLMLIVPSAFAAKLQQISTLTNANLNQMYKGAGDEILSNAFKVAIATPANGRSAADVRRNTVAQAAHSLCGFFDDGVNLSADQNSAGAAVSAVNSLDDSGSIDQGELKKMSDALTAALNDGIEIYSGDASGNNTSGTVLGVYDVKNDEVVVFSYTNCGSDD